MRARIYACSLLILFLSANLQAQAEQSQQFQACEALIAPQFNKRITHKLANRLYKEISEALVYQGSFREAENDPNQNYFTFIKPGSSEEFAVDLNQIRLAKVLFQKYRGRPLEAENVVLSEMQQKPYEPLRLLLIYLVGTQPLAGGLLTPEHLQWAKSFDPR